MKKQEETEKNKEIVEAYLGLVEKLKRIPNLSDFQMIGISRPKIRHHFSNMTKLHQYIQEHFKSRIEKTIITEASLFTQKKMDELDLEISKYKRFFITTVVGGKSVNEKFLKSIRSYCEKNNAKLLILLCEDMASRLSGSGEFTISNHFREDTIVTKDIKLNENIFLNTIKLSAKHINPLTGLSRIGQRNGSFIYASPKQFLEYVATSPKHNKIPHALMTTGALTTNEYNNDLYMSQRTSYLAENDHVMGGIIVEIVDEKKFHFRQVQADETGSFYDLGVKYAPNGKTKKEVPSAAMGDWHVGDTSQDVIDAFVDIGNDIGIQDVFLHDFYNGHSICHHDLGNSITMARKHSEGRSSLREELEDCANDMNFIINQIKGCAVVVKSNHDEWINRYLERGGYLFDPQNHYTSLVLAQKMLEGVDPLKYGIEHFGGFDKPDRVIWLKRDDEYKIGNVEMAAHGDLGANGSRGSLNSLERAYGNCVVGHTHSAAIYRGVFRVGTSTKLGLDYVKGPSSWTQTLCLIYKNGSRQLINVIDGDWRLKDET